MADLEAARARMLRDIDPVVVSIGMCRRYNASLEQAKAGKRCETNQVVGYDGQCWHCGAGSGEACRDKVQEPPE